MATLCNFLLNEKWRRIFSCLVMLLNIIVFVFGIFLFAYGVKFHMEVDKYEYFVKKFDFRHLLRLIIIVGAGFILLHGLGFKMWLDLSRLYLRWRFVPACGPWLVVVFLTAIIAFIGGIFCIIQLKDILDTMEQGIKSAMDDYGINIKAKTLMDSLQIRLGCCGCDSYEDWFDTPWMSATFVTEEKKGKGKESGDKFYTDSCPFSCCNPSMHRPCVHHEIKETTAHRNQQTTSMYDEGCCKKLKELIKNTMMVAGCFLRIGALLEIIIVIIGRIVYTAIIDWRNYGEIAMEPTIGFLFSLGKPRGRGARGGADTDLSLLTFASTQEQSGEKVKPPSVRQRHSRMNAGQDDGRPKNVYCVENDNEDDPDVSLSKESDKLIASERSSLNSSITSGKRSSSVTTRSETGSRSISDALAAWFPLPAMRMKLHPSRRNLGHRWETATGTACVTRQRTCSPAQKRCISLRPMQGGYRPLHPLGQCLQNPDN